MAYTASNITFEGGPSSKEGVYGFFATGAISGSSGTKIPNILVVNDRSGSMSCSINSDMGRPFGASYLSSVASIPVSLRQASCAPSLRALPSVPMQGIRQPSVPVQKIPNKALQSAPMKPLQRQKAMSIEPKNTTDDDIHASHDDLSKVAADLLTKATGIATIQEDKNEDEKEDQDVVEAEQDDEISEEDFDDEIDTPKSNSPSQVPLPKLYQQWPTASGLSRSVSVPDPDPFIGGYSVPTPFLSSDSSSARYNILKRGIVKFFDVLKVLLDNETIPGLVFSLVSFCSKSEITIKPILVTSSNIESVRKMVSQKITGSGNATEIYKAFDSVLEVSQMIDKREIIGIEDQELDEFQTIFCTDGMNNSNDYPNSEIISAFSDGKFSSLQSRLMLLGIGRADKSIPDYDIDLFKKINPGKGFFEASTGTDLCQIISGELLGITTKIANNVKISVPKTVPIVSSFPVKTSDDVHYIEFADMNFTQVIPIKFASDASFEMSVEVENLDKKKEVTKISISKSNPSEKNSHGDLACKLAKAFFLYNRAEEDITKKNYEDRVAPLLINLEGAMNELSSWKEEDRIDGPIRVIWEAYEKQITSSHVQVKRLLDDYKKSVRDGVQFDNETAGTIAMQLKKKAVRGCTGYCPELAANVSENVQIDSDALGITKSSSASKKKAKGSGLSRFASAV